MIIDFKEYNSKKLEFIEKIESCDQDAVSRETQRQTGLIEEDTVIDQTFVKENDKKEQLKFLDATDEMMDYLMKDKNLLNALDQAMQSLD